MPIYMDRHDVSRFVTAESVALMHQEDLKIQDRFGCKGLTYWFDEKRHTAFCLVEAPDAKAIENMHLEAHGNIPNRIIEINSAIIESFLGKMEDPAKAKEGTLELIPNSAFRIMMVVAVKNNQPLPTEAAKLSRSFKKINQQITEVLRRHEGNLVRQSACYYLMSFTSAADAIGTATEIHSRCKKLNGIPPHVKIKIALSAGDPVTDKPSLFEGAIRLAERMCDIINRALIISPQVRSACDAEHIPALSPEGDAVFLTVEEEAFIMDLMDYVDANWHDANLKVGDFCKPVHSSKSDLYRKMIYLTGYPLHQFIKNHRLEEAMKLLQRKAGNVAEIAFETGFSSPSYFTKCFQKKYGCMPSCISRD